MCWIDGHRLSNLIHVEALRTLRRDAGTELFRPAVGFLGLGHAPHTATPIAAIAAAAIIAVGGWWGAMPQCGQMISLVLKGSSL
jgi:hypothetical protein